MVLAELHISTGGLWLMGAIAGLTIFLGLPLGRLRNPAPKLRAGLNAVAIGILVFLLFDVLARQRARRSRAARREERRRQLVALHRTRHRVRRRARSRPGWARLLRARRSTARQRRFGPGAAHVDELATSVAQWSDAKRLAMLHRGRHRPPQLLRRARDRPSRPRRAKSVSRCC